MDNDQSHLDPQPDTTPAFSLTCRECDAGQGIASHDEARSEGWIEIEPSPELIEASFCGLFPACRPNDG